MEAAAMRQSIGHRGRSLAAWYAQMTCKVIYDIDLYRKNAYKGGIYVPTAADPNKNLNIPYESYKKEQNRMKKAYAFFGLEHGNTRDKGRFRLVRDAVTIKIEEQTCCICLRNRLETTQPNMFMLTDCSHLCCSRCTDKKLKVSSYFLL